MPIGKYFKGQGNQVMSDMQQTYKDPDKAKSVFYATANKQGQTPSSDQPMPMKPAAKGKKRMTLGMRVGAKD